jgi:cob(I)alamin adenosyltransferase
MRSGDRGDARAAEQESDARLVTESKDDIVKDLQDVEADIRAVKDELAQTRMSPGREQDKEEDVARLEQKLERLEEEASDMESELSR